MSNASIRHQSMVGFLCLISALAMWFYVRRILIPQQVADASLHDHPRGNLSDLYPRWLGTRELLLRGRDPYSPDLTREIQLGYYGRALNSFRQADPKDQQAFAYPAYAVFFLAPLAYIPFEALRVPFYAILVVLIASSVMAWFRVLRWGIAPSYVLGVILITLGSLPAVMGIELQQLTLVVMAMLVSCALSLARRRLFFAGILLAIATIKPQLVLPLATWLTAWTIIKWNERKSFLIGFSSTMGILFAGAQWILPRWIPEFIRAVADYKRYTNAKSLFENSTNPAMGLILSALVVAMTIVICWRLRRESSSSPQFAFAFALVLAVTVVIIPSLSTYNQILLIPGILFLAQRASALWNRNRVTRFTWILSVAIFAWPWLAALALTLASFILPPATVQRAWTLPFYTSLATPLVVLGLMFQYAFTIDRRSEPGILPSTLVAADPVP